MSCLFSRSWIFGENYEDRVEDFVGEARGGGKHVKVGIGKGHSILAIAL